MGPTSILVFSLAAALGFAIFHYIWEPEHPDKYYEWFEKPKITYICLGIFALLLSSIAVYSLDLHPSIGTHVWFVFVLVNSSIGYSAVLGILFGLLFGYWSFMIMSPDQLETESARLVHNRWGYALALIIFMAIVGPGLKGLLERITEIRSAPLQLSLAQPRANATPDASIVQGTFRGERKQPSPLTLSDYYTSSAIPYLKNNIASDNDYIFILKGEPITEKSVSAIKQFNQRNSFVQCLSSIIEETDDPKLLHDFYGVFLHQARSRYSGNFLSLLKRLDAPPFNWIELANIPNPKLLLYGIRARQEYNFGLLDHLLGRRIQPCEWNFDLWRHDNNGNTLSSLYEELLVSFALGSAGANEAAIRHLADWIKANSERQQKDTDDITAEWAIIRAMQYLQLALSQQGMETARQELLRALLGRMEAAFAQAPVDVSGEVLANRSEWTKSSICSAFRKRYPKTDEWVRFRSDFHKTAVENALFQEKDNYEQLDHSKSIALLAVSYLSFSYLYVESAYISGNVSLPTIELARRNALVQECVFTQGMKNPKDAYVLIAKHNELYGRVILSATDVWKKKLFVLGIRSDQINREAFRHLILAQSYLDKAGITATRSDTDSWHETIEDGEDGNRARRRRIDALVGQLSRSITD